MVPAAVELITLPKMEPPAPSAAAAAEPVGAPSFQEHLERVGRRSNDDSTAARDDRPAATVDDTVKPPERRPDDAPEDSADETATIDRPPATDEKPSDEGEVTEEASGEAIIAAAVARIVLVADDEVEAVTEIVTVEEPSTVEAEPKSKAVNKTPAVDALSEAPAAAVDAATQPVIETAADETTEAVEVEKAEAVAGADGSPHATSETAAKTVAEATPEVAPKSDAPTTPTTPTTTAGAGQAGVRDDDGSRKRSSDTPLEKRETSGAAPTDVTTPTAAVAMTTTAAEVPSSDDAPRKENESTGAVGSATDGDPSRTRLDRPHANDGVRPAVHRDAAAARTDGRESSVSLSQADRVRLVERVARAVQTAVDRGGELKLRLSPPELGSLRLQVRFHDGALSARIEAETPAARQALADGLPALRERLAEQNIRVERFDVDLFNSGGGGASQMPQQQYDQGGEGFEHPAGRNDGPARVAAEADATSARTAAPTVADGRLNVIV